MACDDNDDEGSTNNDPVTAGLTVPFTLLTFAMFCLSIQQLMGCPTSKTKVFRYRMTVTIACFTALIIAIALNFEMEQDRLEDEDKEALVDSDFVLFVRVLMAIYVFEALILGYWFLIDAVGAAFKATHGINQMKPPGWIRKFWLVVIVMQQSTIILCFIFTFAMENVFWENVMWLTTFCVATMASFAILGCAFAVHRSLDTASATGVQTQTSQQRKTLQQARKTLKTMFAMGLVFCVVSLSGLVVLLFTVISNLQNNILDPCVKNLDSRVLDNPWDYVRFMVLINIVDFVIILWTYRGSNMNYCFYHWTYKNYTEGEYRDKPIDQTVVCYRCFPNMIENIEEKRQQIIDDSSVVQNRDDIPKS